MARSVDHQLSKRSVILPLRSDRLYRDGVLEFLRLFQSSLLRLQRFDDSRVFENRDEHSASLGAQRRCRRLYRDVAVRTLRRRKSKGENVEVHRQHRCLTLKDNGMANQSVNKKRHEHRKLSLNKRLDRVSLILEREMSRLSHIIKSIQEDTDAPFIFDKDMSNGQRPSKTAPNRKRHHELTL